MMMMMNTVLLFVSCGLYPSLCLVYHLFAQH